MVKAMPVLILGAGQLALTVRQRLMECGNYETMGFVQTVDPENRMPELDGLPVHYSDGLKAIPRDWRIVQAIGSTARKEAFVIMDRLGFSFESIIHPTIFRDDTMEAGRGCLCLPGSTFSSYIRFGDGVLTTNSVNLGHHVTVGDFSTIAQGAIVGGCVTIGKQAFVGMGAVILDHLSIGDGAVIGAGAVVTRDVSPATKVLGVPARVIQENITPH